MSRVRQMSNSKISSICWLVVCKCTHMHSIPSKWYHHFRFLPICMAIQWSCIQSIAMALLLLIFSRRNRKYWSNSVLFERNKRLLLSFKLAPIFTVKTIIICTYLSVRSWLKNNSIPTHSAVYFVLQPTHRHGFCGRHVDVHDAVADDDNKFWLL